MDFHVEPDALRSLAASFQAAADTLGRAGSNLSGSGRLPGDAFGLLPQAQSAGSQYQGKLDQAVRSLENAQATLGQVAANLQATASNYELTDFASAPP